MKRTISITAVLIAFHFLFPSFANTQDINEILTRMIEGSSSANYQGTITTIFINTPFPQVHQYKIVNYGGSHRREELLSDQGGGRVNFDDGKFLWRFFPSKNMVIKEKSRIGVSVEFPIRDNLDLLKENYGIKLVGEYTIEGRQGHKILFEPEKHDRPKQIFWIDSQTGVPLKIEKYGPDSNLVSVTSFSEIKFTLPQDRESLSLKVPPQTSISEVKEQSNLSIEKASNLMGRRVILPKYLPSGFVMKNVAFRVSGDEKVLQVFFTDGLSALSVFEKGYKPEEDLVDTPFGKIHVKRREAFINTSGTLNIMNIRSEDISLTLVGEVFREEMAKVAESLGAEKTSTHSSAIQAFPDK